MVFWCDCFQRNGYQQISTAAGGSQGMKIKKFKLKKIVGVKFVKFLGPRFGVRHVQCLLVFFGLAVAYALRVNLSVAIVAMTDRNSTNPNFQVKL